MTRASDLARLIGAGATINDGTTITTADNTAQLILKSTDADGNDGPLLNLNRDSSSPVDGDLTGRINFNSDNDAGEVTAFSSIRTFMRDASDGTEDGAMQLNHMFGGTEVVAFEIDNDEYVINQGGNDIDFRVESNGEENMLFVDAGNNRVGIGTTGGSGETLTVTKSGADATVRVNAVSSQEASLKLQGNNTVTNTFKIASEEDDSGLTVQKWNGSAYVTHLKSDANGHITKPLQPAFLVFPSGDQDNISTGTTIVFDSEVFDQNGDFASNTFTAPVTGRYQLSYCIRIDNVESDAIYTRTRLVTSNRTVQPTIIDLRNLSGDPAYWHFQVSILVDMDANDTAHVEYNQSQGVTQADVKNTSFFSGYLAC